MSKQKGPGKPKRGTRPSTKRRTAESPAAVVEPDGTGEDVDAAFEDANKYFAEQDRLDPVEHAVHDGPSEEEPESDSPTSDEKVERWIWLLHEFDDYPDKPSGRKLWDKFLAGHKGVSKQNFRDLYHARANLGEGDLKAGEALLRRALLELGHGKTVLLSRIPDLTVELAQQLLDQGLDVDGAGRLRPLASITTAALLRYNRLKAEAKKHPLARHHLKWPESLIGHTNDLVADWPAIEAQIPQERTDVRQMLAMNLDDVLALRTTLLTVLKEIEQFLQKHGEASSFPDDLVEPAEVLHAACQRIGRGRNAGKIAGAADGGESLKTEEELRRMLQTVLQDMRVLGKAP